MFKFKTFNFLVVFFMLQAICSRLYAPAVNAQQAAIGLGPPITYIAIQPGKSVSPIFTVENKGDPGIVKLRVRPLQVTDSAGHIAIKELANTPVNFSLEQDNLDFKLEDAFFIKHNESKKIRLRVEVPADLPEKDYYYSLLAEFQPPPEEEGVSSVRVKVTTVSNIILTVTQTGELENKGEILSFNATSSHPFHIFGKNFFDSSYPIGFDLLLRNSGRNFFHPTGKIDLRGQLGAHASFDLPPSIITAGLQKKLSLTIPGLYIGKYNVAATISLGEGAPLLFAKTSFVAFPFKIVGITVITVITVIIFIIIKRVKKVKYR